MTAPSGAGTPSGAPGRHRIGARMGAGASPSTAEPWARKLWDAVIALDEDAAADVVTGALDSGVDAESVLLDVIGAVQHKVGVEWAADRLSVAQEHAATALNERAVATLSLSHRPEGERRGRVLVACVDQEWHALPARLLAETLRLRGWQVDYLGARTPTPHLVGHIHRTGPSAVCLSSSLSARLPLAHAALTACQAAGVPVMVGGLAFGHDGRYARPLGADAWAPDARTAADRLAAGLPLPPPPHQTVHDLPHLADQEYTLLRRDSRRLVRETLTGLRARHPSVGAYGEEQLERTAEDLGHIVEALTTALYLDEDGLFVDFLGWTAEILTARGVPADSLLPALDLLEEQVRDFLRAPRVLRAGRAALRDHR